MWKVWLTKHLNKKSVQRLPSNIAEVVIRRQVVKVPTVPVFTRRPAVNSTERLVTETYNLRLRDNAP